MTEQCTCGCECNAAPKLIFSCSGSADTGEVADKAARKLTKDGIGKMFCLAGIGGRVSGIMKSTESALDILVIDGCQLNCAKKSLEEAEFNNFKHLLLSEIGMDKGKTEANEANVNKVVQKAQELLSK